MDDKTPNNTADNNKQPDKKKRTNDVSLLFYVVGVFTILGIGLLTIIIRSSQ